MARRKQGMGPSGGGVAAGGSAVCVCEFLAGLLGTAALVVVVPVVCHFGS